MSIGIDEKTFGEMNPHKLKLYYKAHEKQILQTDQMMWVMGQYVMSAVGTILANSFSKGSSVKYVEQPMLSKAKEEKEQEEKFLNMTEEEKIAYTENLFMRLQIMGANFELSKDKE